MKTPRINLLLFVIFSLVSIGVLIASLISPSIREIAYAPLRELILPPPTPIVVEVLYSTEKVAWLNDVIGDFESTHPKVNGHPIQIELEKMGSWEIYNAVLDGSRKPVIISPASSLQIAALQDASTAQFGMSLVNPADAQSCHSVVTTPLVLVSWKERSEVLWDKQPSRSMWRDLHDVLVNPQGWAIYSQPDWGYVKFGHTDPLKSNSGFMTILLMTYGYFQTNDGLTSSDILSNAAFQQWFLEMERTISRFEHSTGPLMDKMITYGPSTYDLITVYESTAIEQAENAVGRYGELRVYYPPSLLWSDHPFCIVNADWVSEDQRKASQIFIDYLTSKPAQELALFKYGYRPVDTSIQLDQAGSPFDKYASTGILADLGKIPEVEIPSGSVLNALREFWSRNVNR